MSIALPSLGFALVIALLTLGNQGRAQAGIDGDQDAASVGRLLVPAIRHESGNTRHFDERCSATLVGDPSAAASRLLLSAWHCLEFYSDLSRPIVFEHSSGERSEARVIVSGGGMHSDWALLRTVRTFPRPAAVATAPQARRLLRSGERLQMTGYPRDVGAGGGSRREQQNCSVTGSSDSDVNTDCALRKGASGGGVFAAGSGGYFLGVISRGDSLSQSIFVPVTRFAAQIRPFLASPR